jgi:hypothetical protein
MIPTSSIFLDHSDQTSFSEVFFENPHHLDGKDLCVFYSDLQVQEKQKSHVSYISHQEFIATPEMDKTSSNFQRVKMTNFENNETSPNIKSSSSILSESFEPCGSLNSSQHRSKNNQHENVEHFERQFSFTKMHIPQDPLIPTHFDESATDLNKQIAIANAIAIPSDSIYNSFNKFESRIEMASDSSSSSTSELCVDMVLNDLGSKSHNRTQSFESLNSSYIDIFNNVHLEELD